MLRTSEWHRLLPVALELIDQVNREYDLIDKWSFGGGTAMMVQINHRESHDIDIFLDDAQYLGLLNPETNTFELSIQPSGYDGDGVSSRRYAFGEIGEIDFIVANTLTTEPTRPWSFQGREIQLETIAEIVAKKINYRGKMIQPRDLLDIAAAARAGHNDEIRAALANIPDRTKEAIEVASGLKPEFLSAMGSQYLIKDSFRDLTTSYRDEAVDIMSQALAD